MFAKLSSLYSEEVLFITMEFRRKIYGELLDWKNISKGRSALMLQGARRVGKSTIVERFAKDQYKSYILIDFVETDDEMRRIFTEYRTDLNMLFNRLQLKTGIKLYERESVIIFDEVQAFPLAREMIKILVKDGRYDYIETGSLISIHENVKTSLSPLRRSLWACIQWISKNSVGHSEMRPRFH